LGLLLSARTTRFGLSVGLAGAVALAFDGDHVGVVDDAIDERGGAGSVGEDAGPVSEGEIGGEHGAFLLVAAADDLEEQVGVSVVEGEEADFVEDKQANFGVVLQPALESTSVTFLPAPS
jgi:hypothetical protein